MVTTGRTVGRATAWSVVVAGVGATAVQLLVPIAGRLAAGSTWSGRELVACREAAEPCIPSTLPMGPYLAWIGCVPVALVFLALVVCWSPRRWWFGPGTQRPARPGVFSTPEWFRLTAYAALLLNGCGLLVVGNRDTGVWMLEYLWPIAASLLALVFATVSIRSTAGRIDDETRVLLQREFAFWITSREAALRAGSGRRDRRNPSEPNPDA